MRRHPWGGGMRATRGGGGGADLFDEFDGGGRDGRASHVHPVEECDLGLVLSGGLLAGSLGKVA